MEPRDEPFRSNTGHIPGLEDRHTDMLLWDVPERYWGGHYSRRRFKKRSLLWTVLAVIAVAASGIPASLAVM